MKKIDSIQVLRGIAAVSVILYHMLVIEKKYAGGDHYLPDIFRIGQSGVDLFFVISGFIMVSIISKGKKERSPAKFLLHRFARIYPNYWFYFLVTFAVYLAQPTLVNASQGGRFNFFRSFLLIPSETLPLVLIAWSLIYEVYFYLVFSRLVRFDQLRLLISLLTWLLFLMNVNIFTHTPTSPILSLMVSPYSIEFIWGAFAAMIVSTAVIRRLPSLLLELLIAGIVLSLPALYDRFYSVNGAGVPLFQQCLIFGLIFSFLVIAMVALEQRAKLKFFPFLVRIGDISYTIYLSHLLILGAMGRIWAGWFQYPGMMWDEIIVFPLMLAVIVAWSRAAHRLIERPSYHFFVKWLESPPFIHIKSKEH